MLQKTSIALNTARFVSSPPDPFSKKKEGKQRRWKKRCYKPLQDRAHAKMYKRILADATDCQRFISFVAIGNNINKPVESVPSPSKISKDSKKGYVYSPFPAPDFFDARDKHMYIRSSLARRKHKMFQWDQLLRCDERWTVCSCTP